MFIKGQEYRRRDLHRQYGGQEQGGISTPKSSPSIFLFTGEMGEEYGYTDGWTPEGVYLYTGQGTLGDMVFQSGNKAIRDHLANGENIYLFEYTASGSLRFVDQMICVGYQYERKPDREKKDRQAIVFQFHPVDALQPKISALTAEPVVLDELQKRSLKDLRAMALAAATHAPTAVERTSLYRRRSAIIVSYALQRANGICGGCDQPAPFLTPSDLPFLEVHHLDRLADDGPDHPEAVIAVCPNCHRRAHYAKDAPAFNEQLRGAAKEQEMRSR